MKTAVYISLFAAAAFLVCGCQNKLEPDSVDSGGISFNPSVRGIVNTEVTKVSALRSADGSVEMPLSLEISDGIGGAAGPQTKGQQLNTTGTNQPLSDYIQKFYVRGWKGTTRFLPTADSYYEISYSGTAWSSATSYGWEDDDDRTFYAYANLPSSTGVASVSNGTSGSQLLTYSAVPADAASQNDILMGYSTGNTTSTGSFTKDATGKTCTAGITFYHPLTAVRFKKGSFFGDVEFKAIYVNGVYKSGKTTLNPTEIVKTDAGDRFTWTDLSTEMQDATLEAGIDAGKDITTTTQKLAVDGTSYIIGEPFLLIPQNLSDKPVQITVVVKIDGVIKILSATCDNGGWEAGKTYTYTLGYENFLLTVDGEVSTDYQGNGSKTYTVNSSADWKLQYKTSGGTWADAAANTLIDGWIRFNTVSGSGSNSAQTVTATVTAGSSMSLPNEHSAILQTATPKGTADAPYDLSMHTIYGESRTAGPVTANSYVINAPGWYAFPLVYGNAIDYNKVPSGGVNTAAYDPSGSGTNFLTPFMSSTGAITSPYISGVTSAYPHWEDVPGYSLIAQNGCSVLSQSAAADKGLTGCNCGYVVFQVPSTLTQGNAVIAVKDAGGDILWSWHIWVTDSDLTCRTVTNTGGTFSKGVMPLNLGWVDLGTSTGYERKNLQIRFVQIANGVVKNEVAKNPERREYVTENPAGQSPTYQWGRKDPFIRAKADGTELSTTEYSGEKLSASNALSSLAASIKYPAVFFYSTTGIAWSSGGGNYDNLWSASLTRNGSGEGYTAAPVKTVYDPCPPGFQVPQMDAFSHFVTPSRTEWKTGFKLETFSGSGEYLFFPAPGNRNGGSPSAAMTGVDSVTRNGRYWTAAPNYISGNEKYAYHLFVSDMNVSVDPDKASLIYKEYGNSIRPVQETSGKF